ncbi:ankyrin-3-like [Orbicella faveolata]|uniref:ankyrin-3-like n=1 Tax=Orbicella faveolata TaxID=48498 RepID=UPI0009E261DF|nr:ankyrin-3-like [Orbicella faveolata]
MTSKKDDSAGSVLLTPLLGVKARKSDTVDASNSMPSICYLPSRSSKNLLGLERESVENATVSLHQAARDGKRDLVERRLEMLGKGNKKINKKDQENTTALHYAVRYNHLHIVKLLLDYGADIEARGEDDATPLHYAARFRPVPRIYGGTPRPTPQVTPSPSMENISDNGLVLKKDDKKKEGGSGSFGKGTKDRLLGSLNNKREKLGNKLFPKDFLTVEKRSSFSKEPTSASPFIVETMIMYLLSQKAKVNARDRYGSTPLHYAVAKGNPDAVKELLTDPGIDIEAKDKTEMTPLHVASSQGSLSVAECLIEAGADLRSLDEEQMTPLHFACMEGSLEVAQLLFKTAEERGGWSLVSKMVIDQDREEQTALHLAVEDGDQKLAKLCLDKGANVNAHKMNMSTPLHLAATGGDLEIVKMLIEHDANIEAKNASQETPLHRAAQFNRVNIVDFLLSEGAFIECRDKDKDTPLLMAASKNHLETIKSLLSHNADIGAKDSNDETPIYRAASEGCIEALEFLLKDRKGKTLVEEYDKYENTPLHVAAKKGYVRIVQLLLDNGCCIDSKNDGSLTPLHLAAKFGRIRTVCALLKRDMSIINDEDDASNTPLHLAALHGYDKVAKELLDRGAAIDARNANLWTPLDCAAAKGWVEAATVLLDENCPVDPTDKAKTTPLHLAAREGHVEMVKLLLSRKANITLTDSAGRNCLDMAIENNHKEVALVIIQHNDWRQAMRNKTKDGTTINTPMRKLIKKLPEVAEKVFNRCVKSNGYPVDHPQYGITLSYEFLDDVSHEWAGFMTSDTSDHEGSGVDTVMYKIKSALPENASKQVEIKSNHPLMLMVTKERVKLLSHPLVTYLLRYKWRSFGRYVYYGRLILYGIFLYFLTGYAMLTTKSIPIAECHDIQCTCNVTFAGGSTGSQIMWRTIGRPVVLVTTSISLFLEIFKFFYMWRLYFQWNRLIEVLAYVFSMIYVIDDFQLDRTSFTIFKGSRQVGYYFLFLLLLFFFLCLIIPSIGLARLKFELSKTK